MILISKQWCSKGSKAQFLKEAWMACWQTSCNVCQKQAVINMQRNRFIDRKTHGLTDRDSEVTCTSQLSLQLTHKKLWTRLENFGLKPLPTVTLLGFWHWKTQYRKILHTGKTCITQCNFEADIWLICTRFKLHSLGYCYWQYVLFLSCSIW